jgi:hypothetical protein
VLVACHPGQPSPETRKLVSDPPKREGEDLANSETCAFVPLALTKPKLDALVSVRFAVDDAVRYENRG